MPIPISGRTALAGVLGDPVRHSLSPAMHNAALEVLGLDWVYLALPVAPAELAGALRALEALDCRGLNVTLPHKQAVAALAAELTPLAARLGAVNTLVRRPQGGWQGTNTDVEGFLAPLREREEHGDWGSREALVLGTGGSARAVVAGLVELGVGRIRLAGRRAERTAELLEQCRDWSEGLEGVAWAQGLEAAVGRADLLINTTPVGMAAAHDPAAAGRSPLEREALERLRAGTVVYDLIYTPRPTALLRQAAARGCPTIDGLEMLVRQGAASLGLWSGRRDLPLDAMRAAALAQLQAP